MTVLIDTNVLIDFLDGRSRWAAWSVSKVEEVSSHRRVLINSIIYAELSVGFETETLLDDVLLPFERDDIPWSAAFSAGKAFLRYRRAGGLRSAPLPDFFIGAHAAVNGYAILTRDAARYRTYFPAVELITPESLP